QARAARRRRAALVADQIIRLPPGGSVYTPPTPGGSVAGAGRLAPRRLELALEVVEAALDVGERALHAARAPDDVVELSGEPMPPQLDVAEPALAVLDRLGAPDEDVAGAGMDQVDHGARAENGPEEQREEKPDHDHVIPLRRAGRPHARRPRGPRARRAARRGDRAAAPGPSRP